jgi:hypothetical protein
VLLPGAAHPLGRRGSGPLRPAIGEAHGRPRRELEQLKTETATAANEKVALFDLLVGLLLDDSIADEEACR